MMKKAAQQAEMQKQKIQQAATELQSNVRTLQENANLYEEDRRLEYFEYELDGNEDADKNPYQEEEKKTA